MAIFAKSALAVLGGALLLGGCATDPYYDNSGYNYGYNGYDVPAYGYDVPAPAYYGPSYVEPSVGFGIGFSDYSGDRHWGHDHDGDRHEWRGDRGGHDWHGDRHGDRGDHDWHGDRGGAAGVDQGGHGDWRNDHGQNSGG